MGIEDILKKTNAKLDKATKDNPFSFGHDRPRMASEDGLGDPDLWIPTGVWPLDCALGGGLAMGRVTELFSDDEGEGKTTTALTFVRPVQKVKGSAAWLESETALDKIRAAGMGVDLKSTIKWTPDTLEDGFRYLKELVHQIATDKDQKGKPTIIVWDTIAMARTEAERDGDAFRDGIGAGPRAISTALRNFAQEFAAYNVHVVLVNQSYTDINSAKSKYMGPQMQTPGGKRIKFVASYRIKVKKCGFIGHGRTVGPQDEKLGIKVRMTIVKNKLALPYRSLELYLYGNTGYNDIMSQAHMFLEDGPYKWLEGLEVKNGGRYQPIGASKSCYWSELPALMAESPESTRLWREHWLQVFPIHESRQPNADGWYARVPGVATWTPTPDGILGK
jgi:protein RecA